MVRSLRESHSLEVCLSGEFVAEETTVRANIQCLSSFFAAFFFQGMHQHSTRRDDQPKKVRQILGKRVKTSAVPQDIHCTLHAWDKQFSQTGSGVSSFFPHSDKNFSPESKRF